MPFQSEAQRRLLHAKEPEVANKWEKKYGPPKKKKKGKGKGKAKFSQEALQRRFEKTKGK